MLSRLLSLSKPALSLPKGIGRGQYRSTLAGGQSRTLRYAAPLRSAATQDARLRQLGARATPTALSRREDEQGLQPSWCSAIQYRHAPASQSTHCPRPRRSHRVSHTTVPVLSRTLRYAAPLRSAAT